MNHADIEQLLCDFLTSAGYVCDTIEVKEDPSIETIVFNIKTPNARNLIGRGGDVAHALNHLLRRMVEQRMPRGVLPPKFSVDIDGYFSSRIEALKVKANIIADRARSFKSDIAMEPMSSYERLIIHAFLSDKPEISTESIGEGEKRHVVIKYNSNKTKKEDTSDLRI